MRQAKIAIIGAGAVGSTAAYALILKDIASEILLVDINEQRCKGEILDLSDALGFSYCSKITKVNLDQTKKADIVIICAGIAQKPGQPRTELVSTNKKIITSIIKDLKPIPENQIIIMVTNPVDAMTFFALKESEAAYNKIFGTGTFLDSQRIKGFISEKLKVEHISIDAYVLGEHGESQVPVWSTAKANDIPILDFPGIEKKDLEQFAQQTKQKASEIIKCKGATFFGIAACVASLCESILFDQKQTVPVSIFSEEFGICLSMPTIIGHAGIEKLIKPKLNVIEKEKLNKSAEKIKKTIKEA